MALAEGSIPRLFYVCVEYTSINNYVQTSKLYLGPTFHAHRFEKHYVPLVNPINGSKQTLQVLVSHEQVYRFFNSLIVLLHQILLYIFECLNLEWQL